MSASTSDRKTAGNAPLSAGVMFAFSMPSLMMGFMHAPEAQIQGIYAKLMNIPLAAMAGAVLLTRMLDAVTYPLIGFLSDYTFSRYGTRKPWILAGTFITVLGLWFLYHPAAGAGLAWFALWMSVAYVGWKLTEIPYGAWSYSITQDYVQRQRVQIWRVAALLLGNLLFYAAPYAARALGFSEGTALDFQTLGFSAIVIVAVVPLVNLVSLARVPEGDAPPPPAGPKVSRREQLREFWEAFRDNRPLLRFVAALVVLQGLVAMSGGVFFLFIDVYLHLGDKFPLISLVAAPASLLGLPVWGWLALKFERHRVWSVSMVMIAGIYLAMGMVPVGEQALPYLLVIYPIALFAVGGTAVAAPAIMGDIRDYDYLKSGKDRAGIYSAIMAFTGKSLLGIAGAAGLALAGWFGFDATAAAQDAGGTFGIRFTAAWLPALGFFISALLMWNFPIDRARQREIAAGLKAREAAANADG